MPRIILLLAGLAGLLGATPALAKVEADPNKDYTVTAEAGPWLICAATYTGSEAKKLAKDLTLEIRSKNDLPAYVFDRSADERRKRDDERNKLRMKYPQADLSHIRTVRIQDQCVVLVGGYKDMETARKALDDIKKLKPTSERFMPFIFSRDSAAQGKEKGKGDVQGAYVSPFLDAFVVPNPVTKREKVEDPREKAFLKNLNDGESFSLLKCRQPYTLLVAVYHGTTVVQSKEGSGTFLDKLFGNSQGENLAASGLNAHNFADAMRKLGFDAYVLHTPKSSMVTVGGFSSPDDPKISQVKQALQKNLKLGERIELLPEPLAIEVPRL